MKKIIFLVVIISLVFCENEKTKSSMEAEDIQIVRSVSVIIKKRDFPLKDFSKIELVSY
jgi:hypothetical protein